MNSLDKNAEKTIPVIMIYPRMYRSKKTIQSGLKFSENEVLLEEENGFLKAELLKGNHFGARRSFLQLEKTGEISLEHAAQALGLLEEKFLKEKTRYPLYAVLDSDQFEEIMLLSRLGYYPFLGEWKEASEEDSVQIWEQITTTLKKISE